MITQPKNTLLQFTGADDMGPTMQEELDQMEARGLVLPDVQRKAGKGGGMQIDTDDRSVSAGVDDRLSIEVSESPTQVNVNRLTRELEHFEGKLRQLDAEERPEESKYHERQRLTKMIEQHKQTLAYEITSAKQRGEGRYLTNDRVTDGGVALMLAEHEAQNLPSRVTRRANGSIQVEVGLPPQEHALEYIKAKQGDG